MSQQRTKPDLSPSTVLANLVDAWLSIAKPSSCDDWVMLVIPRIQYDRARALCELVKNKEK